jgi:hypothetical protein
MKQVQLFADVIAEFKTKENARPLYILQRDEELQKLIAGWGPEVLTLSIDITSPPEDPKQKWKWLWDQVTVDHMELVRRSSVVNIIPKLEQAKSLQLIYPDGSVSQYTEGLMTSKIRGKIDK